MRERADVVLIGGGFAGAATAYFLAQRGVRDVAIVEREAVCGYHASGRNAALGRQLVEDDQVTELTVRGAAFLRHPPPEFSDAPLLSASGSVLVCATAGDQHALIDRARGHGIPAEPISMDNLFSRWPRLCGMPGHGAVFFPTDGVIDVHALLQGYLAAARAGGAAVTTGCEVTAIGDGPEGARVDTSLGPIDARVVAICAGAWADEVATRAGVPARSLTPIHRHLFVSQPAADLDREAPFVWHLGDELYVRPEGAGYLMSSCDETVAPPGDAQVMPGAREHLAAKLCRVAPAFGDLGIARAWACLRTFAPDGRPVIGPDDRRPWLFWVAGLGGHGATASAAVGELAAAGIYEQLSLCRRRPTLPGSAP